MNTSSWFMTLKEAPDAAWELLTDPKHLSQWFDPGAKIELKKGSTVLLPGGTEFRDGVGRAEVLDFVSGRSVDFKWPINDVDTKLRWILESSGSGTKFIVTCEAPDGDEIRP